MVKVFLQKKCHPRFYVREVKQVTLFLAKERTRMQLMNEAFDLLREVIPNSGLQEHRRLSKIATLRLAIQYIKALTQILLNEK